MKNVIVCGCGNQIEFEREEGKVEVVCCKTCGAKFKSTDKGYIYTK